MLVLCFNPAASSALGHGPRNAFILDSSTGSKSFFWGSLPSSRLLSTSLFSAHLIFSSETTKKLSPSVGRESAAKNQREKALKLRLKSARLQCRITASIIRLHSSHQSCVKPKNTAGILTYDPVHDRCAGRCAFSEKQELFQWQVFSYVKYSNGGCPGF